MDERNTMQLMIMSACAKYNIWETLPKERQESIVRKMERSCYNNAVTTCAAAGIDRQFTKNNSPFVMRYQANCYRILANIDKTSSVLINDFHDHLVNKICNNEVSPDNIIELTSYELYPWASQAEIDAVNLRKEQKIELKTSRRHTCNNCGKNETVQQEYTSRAADESAKISIKCVNCGNVWRKN